jgi:predicted metal-binding protein
MVTGDPKQLEAVFAKYGCTDWKWLDPKEIVVAQWVRMKCMFGCRHYGHNATCPPNTLSVLDCRQFFDEYRSAVVFHFQKAFDHPDDRHAWTREISKELSKLERDVFLLGFQKAFLLFMDTCGLCEECTGKRGDCKQPKMARPTPEGMAMDVYSTVRKVGFPIQVLAEYSEPMNRYAFLLLE